MRKSANKDRVDVSPELASGEVGRKGRWWNVMYSFGDFCYEVQMWKDGVTIKRRISL